VKAAREDWLDNQGELDPERLIFIDESGFSTKMARLRGCGTHFPAQGPVRALPARVLGRQLGACTNVPLPMGILVQAPNSCSRLAERAMLFPSPGLSNERRFQPF
jgi:hypothetical protein